MNAKGSLRLSSAGPSFSNLPCHSALPGSQSPTPFLLFPFSCGVTSLHSLPLYHVPGVETSTNANPTLRRASAKNRSQTLTQMKLSKRCGGYHRFPALAMPEGQGVIHKAHFISYRHVDSPHAASVSPSIARPQDSLPFLQSLGLPAVSSPGLYPRFPQGWTSMTK